MMHTTLKGRLEDARMLTGRGRYVSDWSLPRQAHGVFLRSERAHAEVAAIDARAALAMPGVLAVLTGEDVAAAGLKSLPAAAPMKGRGGAELLKPHRAALAQRRVRYVGEPLALVVAESEGLAQDAAEAIAVEYRDLPAVTGALEALAPGAPQLHEGVPGNLALDFVSGDEAAANAAFARAARVVRLASYHTRVVGNPMEPRGCVAAYDPADGTYALYGCIQGASGMRAQLAPALDVAPEKIRVIAEEVGGGFGVRFNAYPEYCAALLAARKLGRPVKWVGTRSEMFLADEQARDIVQRGELAVDASGRILGMRFEFVCNLGAYLAFTGAFVNTVNLVNCVSGVYDVQAVAVRARLVLTNTVPTAAYRGAGRPVSSYAIERLVDEAAHELGIDAAEFRRRNFIPANAFPYRIVTGFEYDCGDFEAVLDHALRAADWNGFEARRAASAARGRLRGRGIATYIEASGAGGFAPQDEVRVRWDEGARITLNATSHSHGQGHETVYAQIVAGVLGVPLESIRLQTAQPDLFLTGNPTGGSRSLLGVGSVMQLAAHEVVKKGLALAAEELETAAADLEFVAGRYRVKGTDREIALAELAKRHAGRRPHPLDVDFGAKFGATFPNGCHVAEIEIEPETGLLEIVRYVACDDAGTIINHQIVEGQMQGGITQGAGHVLGEQAIYDRETGQLLGASFMDYPMPRAILVNELSVLHHPVPTRTNPLGAKGVGEAGVTGSMPAIMNAVLDALRRTGVEYFDMPASPLRLWQAIEAARAGRAAALALDQDLRLG
ncbi:MAG: xanthine dehydrogenase family protein molybdopterin-binding subunit [Betaproteobacteria bacterium]|nr:xanthine dehydrogenase family protein molybdopterin-binding subunit [Betaproteobacteria bacterium]